MNATGASHAACSLFPSRGQDWFHMLDEDGSEIIGIRVRCVAEHTMPVSKLCEDMAQARSPRPEC